MNNLHVFAVYDSKAEIYGSPMFFAAKGLATRAFEDQANNPESLINKHAPDFTLFEIGTYDQDSGQFTQDKSPKSWGTALEYQNQEQ